MKQLIKSIYCTSSHVLDLISTDLTLSNITVSRQIARLLPVQRPCTLQYLWSVRTIQPRLSRSFNSSALKSQASATNAMSFKTPSSDPPKNEMAYFPDMTTLASQSGEFRRVLWTGRYSQIVIMTVPVDGDIGDEVRQ